MAPFQNITQLSFRLILEPMFGEYSIIVKRSSGKTLTHPFTVNRYGNHLLLIIVLYKWSFQRTRQSNFYVRIRKSRWCFIWCSPISLSWPFLLCHLSCSSLFAFIFFSDPCLYFLRNISFYKIYTNFWEVLQQIKCKVMRIKKRNERKIIMITYWCNTEFGAIETWSIQIWTKENMVYRSILSYIIVISFALQYL